MTERLAERSLAITLAEMVALLDTGEVLHLVGNAGQHRTADGGVMPCVLLNVSATVPNAEVLRTELAKLRRDAAVAAVPHGVVPREGRMHTTLSDLYDADCRTRLGHVGFTAERTYVPHPLSDVQYADGATRLPSWLAPWRKMGP